MRWRDNQWMQVAVAGMSNVRDLNAVRGSNLADLLQHLGDPGPGHADVLGQHRSKPLKCGICEPPGVEESLRLGIVGRLLDPDSTGVGHRRSDRGGLTDAGLSWRIYSR